MYYIVEHVKNCCGVNIKEKRITKKLSIYIGKITAANDPPKSFELVNAVPEVKHNYKEFQEPFIGQD